VVPAFADVGAVRALADRIELERAGELFERVIVFAHRRAGLEPLRLGGGSCAGGGDLYQRCHVFIVIAAQVADILLWSWMTRHTPSTAGIVRKIRDASRQGLSYGWFMHRTIEPTILYFGTPVALISTLNPDGSPNLAPMSSVWWLGWSCMLGLGQMSQSSDNLIRTRECVINLPSQDLVGQVDRLALTTGKNPVPEKKLAWGYQYKPDKFGVAGFTPVASQSVAPPRVVECPIQMEGIVHEFRSFGKNVSAHAFEVHIVKLHVDEALLEDSGGRTHIDPLRWSPLIMSFCRFFGLGSEVHPSRLAGSDFMKFVNQGSTPQAASLSVDR